MWNIDPLPNGNLLVETFSVEHAATPIDDLKLAAGGLTAMYGTWTAMLTDLTRISGGQVVVGPNTDLNGRQIPNVQPYYQRVLAPGELP